MGLDAKPVNGWPSFASELPGAPTKSPLWAQVGARAFKSPLRYLFILDPGLYITRTAWQTFAALITMFLVGYAVGTWGDIPGITVQFGILSAGAYVTATTTSLRTYLHKELLKRAAMLYFATALAGLIAVITTFHVAMSTVTFLVIIAAALWLVRYGPLGEVAAQCAINGYLINMMLFQVTPNLPRWYAYAHAQAIGALAVTAMVVVRSILSINSSYRHVMYVRLSLYATRQELCFFAACLLLYPDSRTWRWLRMLRGRFRRVSLVADAVVSSHQSLPQDVGEAFHRDAFEIDMMVGSLVGLAGRVARAVATLRSVDVAPRSHRALVEWTVTDLAGVFLLVEKKRYISPADLDGRLQATKAHLRSLEQALRLAPVVGQPLPKPDTNHGKAVDGSIGASGASPGHAPAPSVTEQREENLQKLVRGAHRLTVLLRQFAALLRDTLEVSEAASAHHRNRVTKRFTTGVHYANYAPAGKHDLAEQSAREEKLGIIILHLNNRALIQGIVAVLIATGISYLLDPEHFYWGTIGAYVMMRGTSVRSDSYRKVVNRLVGTAVGGALGMLVPLLLGKWHAIIQMGVLALALAIASGLLTVSHLWFTTFLTIAFIQLYSFFQPEALIGIIAQRLVLNGSGALVGALVASFLFPVRSGEVIETGISNLIQALSDFLSDLAASRTRAQQAHVTAKARRIENAVDQIEEIVRSVIRTPRNARRTSMHQNVLATLRSVQARCDMLAFLVEQRVEIPHVEINPEDLTREERKRLLIALNSQVGQGLPRAEKQQKQLEQNERLQTLKVDLALNQQIRLMRDNLPKILVAYEQDAPQPWPRVAPALDDLSRYLENTVRDPGPAVQFVDELSRLDDALGSLMRQATRM